MAKSINERLSVAKTRITLHHPFWAVIVLNVEFIVDTLLRHLAATDCAKKIFINPDRCAKITDPEFMGLMMHELLHIVFMTSARLESREPELWNRASDYVINLIVVDEMGYTIPEGGCYDKRFLGMTAETVYDMLEQEAQQQKKQKQQRLGGTERQKKTGKDSGAAAKAQDDSKNEDNAPGGGGSDGFDLHLPFPSGGEQDVKDMVSMAKTIWDSISEGKDRGTMGGVLTDYLKHLLKPQVPWEREFHKYAGLTIGKEDYSLSPPHRRYLVEDLIVPALRSYHLGRLVVHIDSSGSTKRALYAFASELAKMVTLVDETTIIVADCMIQEVVKTKDVPAFLSKLKIKGGGGTDHRPVFEEIKKQKMEPELFIGLTDGDTCYPDKKPAFPVMWCLTSEQASTPWGKRVFIDV